MSSKSSKFPEPFELPEGAQILHIQKSRRPDHKAELDERWALAVESLRDGIIGIIENVNQDLVGKWVACIGDQYPFEVALLIKEVNKGDRTVLINGGKLGDKWVPINDLRFLSAVSEIINAPLRGSQRLD